MKNIESLLFHALTPTAGDEPDSRINQKILQAYEEEFPMKQKLIKRPAMAILAAAAIITCGSLTAVASWHYLSPSQVAKDAGDDKLSKAFQDEEALSINESQTIGDYKITLNSIVSGKSISSLTYESDEEIVADRTYAVLSIENKDGTPMSSTDRVADVIDKEHFIVSPFIQGCDVNRINMYTLQAGATTSLKDGIMYKLIDCDDLEIFADREVYLGVLKTEGNDIIDSSAYVTDKKTGRISRSKNYSGVNALFTLPLDKNKADRKKADTLLKKWLEPDETTETEEDSEEIKHRGKKPKWTAKQIQKEGVYLKKYTKKAKPDKDGLIPFGWKDQGFESDSVVWLDDLKDLKKGSTEILFHCGNEERRYFVLGTREEGEYFTLRLYYLNL